MPLQKRPDSEIKLWMKSLRRQYYRILAQCSISILSENVRNPKVFRRFREYKNGIFGTNRLSNAFTENVKNTFVPLETFFYVVSGH